MSRSNKQIPEQAKQIQSELFTLTYGVLVAQLLEDIEDTKLINTKLDKIGHNIGVRIIDDIFSRNPNLKRCKDLNDTAEAIVNFGFKPYLNMIPKIDNWSAKKDEFSLILENNILTEFVELNEIDSLKEPSINGGLDNINTKNASNINKESGDVNLSIQQKNINETLVAGITSSKDPANITQALTELELDDNSIPTKGLNYCQMLCGVIRGALEMVQIQVQVQIINDALRPNNELVVNNDESYKNKTQLRVKFIRKMEEAMPVGDG